MANDPGEILQHEDPGDDVQRRFRYQHAYAAIQCVRLLETIQQVVAVYCENYEDVLLRLSDGLYVGVQVKTRKFNGHPFKANEDAVIKSIIRFAALEGKYPDKFKAYRFVTNYIFYEAKNDAKFIRYQLDAAKACKNYKRLPKDNDLKSYINGICNSSSFDELLVLRALKKLELTDFRGRS